MNSFRGIALRFILSVFIFVGVSNLVMPDASQAAPSCRLVFARESAAKQSRLLDVSGRDSLTVSGAKLREVKELFLKFGVEIDTKNLVEALEGAAEVLRDGKTEASMELSDTMSKLGEKLLKIVKGEFTKEQELMLSFFVAQSVLNMERISLKDYAPTSNTPAIFSDSGALHITDFHRYVESYVDGTRLYANKNSRAGIINMDAIRHLYSNNTWIIGFKDHDMFHLHYSYGHPFYLAINFMTARSVNDLRYSMISSLWESIDDTQYGYEYAISKYFSARRMSPQEAMIFLGRASVSTLEKINEALGSSYGDYNMQAVAYNNGEGRWKPVPVKFGRSDFPRDAKVFAKELEDYINKSIELKKKTANKKYYNYYRRGEGEDASKDHDKCVY